MKNNLFLVLGIAILLLGSQTAFSVSESTVQEQNASKESKVRTLGASRVASLIVMSDNASSGDREAKRLAPPVQSKMRSAAPSVDAGVKTAPQAAQPQTEKTDYLPYIIALGVCVVAVFFFFRARKR